MQLCLAIAAVIVNDLIVNSIDVVTGDGLLLAALDVATVALLIVDTMFITGLVIQWSNHRYIIMPEEIVVDGGTLHIQRHMYKTNDIESLELQQSMLGKLLNYGTISFYSPLFNHGVQLTNLPDPHKYMRMLAREHDIK